MSLTSMAAALLVNFPRLTSLACSSHPIVPVINALADHAPHLVALSFACQAEMTDARHVIRLLPYTNADTHLSCTDLRPIVVCLSS